MKTTTRKAATVMTIILEFIAEPVNKAHLSLAETTRQSRKLLHHSEFTVPRRSYYIAYEEGVAIIHYLLYEPRAPRSLASQPSSQPSLLHA